MTGEELKVWVTAVAAFVAAVAGIWNLLLQIRGKRDRFVVRLGGASPSIDQETMLHVVSLADHPIKLTDWGFIEASGRFNSFHMDWQTGNLHNEEITSHGTSELKGFGAYFETGYRRKDAPLGAYAISATQTRPHICFAQTVPLWTRLRIWGRLRIQPQYLGW